MKKKYFILFLLVAGNQVFAQKLKKEDQVLTDHLQQHIRFLSDDKLEGRRTGTIGEKLAAEYISTQFSQIGLIPKGTENFFQPFEVNEGRQINSSNFLTIDGKNLVLYKEYFPLSTSPNISLEAISSLALQENGMPWFYDLKELIEENAGNPHFDLEQAIQKSTKEVFKKGASAVILYNSSIKEDGIKFNGKDKSDMMPIPVIYITREAALKYLGDEGATLDIKFKTDIGEKKRTGRNVIGFINNGAANTIVLGAHFDHLGYGEDGNSRETDKTARIHNGADDNASGTAAMIELSRKLKSSKFKNNNYLFIAFSGEELGLYGSKYFVEHPTIEISKINFMINMDMVGRLNDSSHVLTVGGYGTSPDWGKYYNLKQKKRLYDENLVFRFDSSGTGPSDHTSFYLKNIPVLFYFTGLHQDYHKPSDDFDKINYRGEMNVVKHIYSLIETQNKENHKLAFTKTREVQMSSPTRLAVTMGIMPDYTYGGAGIRIDGVSDNKPAQKAGLKAGDIILSLGDFKISSMENYMQTLNKFRKGDKTVVTYNRGGQNFTAPLEF